MVRSRFFTSLVVLASFVSGCAGSGEDAGSGGGLTSGADPSAISDPGADADGDGLPGDQDLCPGTAANAKVDGNGCTAEQREASGSGQRGSGKGLASDPGASSDPTAGSEEGESNGAELADGEVTPNGFAVFTLDPDAASPVIFRTLASNVKQLESGFELTGTVLVDVPNDEHVTLLEASVKLEYDAATGQGLQRFSGTVRLPFPSIGFMSDVEFDDLDVETIGYFNGEPSAWYVTLDGQLAVSGIDLSSAAHARLDQQGLQVSGIFETPLSLIDMSGRITRQGVDVRGHAEVTIPIVAGKEQLQWVTDAAVCGYETVTDAAVCGYDTVADGAKCGYDTVKDGTICGFQTVRDATLCGTETVKDAAECGIHAVTSAVECGVSAVSCGWSCVTSLFSSCNCSQANTCNVANTCTIAKSCTTPASCNVPKHCEVPATCERVKTCQTKVTIPDFDYGTFKGVVDLTIGTSGLTGQVEGKYCQNDAGCTTLAGGRVELSSNKPEACVEVAGLGEFCAPF